MGLAAHVQRGNINTNYLWCLGETRLVWRFKAFPISRLVLTSKHLIVREAVSVMCAGPWSRYMVCCFYVFSFTSCRQNMKLFVRTQPGKSLSSVWMFHEVSTILIFLLFFYDFTNPLSTGGR